MRLYIWEGNGISDAYHNDGTLVVLAESPEQARAVVRSMIADRDAREVEWERERDAALAALDWQETRAFWATDEGRALWARHPGMKADVFDGSDSALDREPDRVVDTDKPIWVAFNGGGYD